MIDKQKITNIKSLDLPLRTTQTKRTCMQVSSSTSLSIRGPHSRTFLPHDYYYSLRPVYLPIATSTLYTIIINKICLNFWYDFISKAVRTRQYICVLRTDINSGECAAFVRVKQGKFTNQHLAYSYIKYMRLVVLSKRQLRHYDVHDGKHW